MPYRPLIITAFAACILPVGCSELIPFQQLQQQQRQQPTSTPKRSLPATITVDAILDHCVAAYAELQTLQAHGTLRDNRRDDRRVNSIGWEFQRPDRCRLEIGQNASLVSGDLWWTYDSATRQFTGQSNREGGQSGGRMETASYVLSKGLPLLLPALFERGAAAFGHSRSRGYPDWKLAGAAWLEDRPCYVVSRTEPGRKTNNKLRHWIDQDSYLVRASDMIEPQSDGSDTIIFSVTYHQLIVNAPIDTRRFDLTPPTESPPDAENSDSASNQKDAHAADR